VVAAAVSPDGRALATLGLDYRLIVWETATGKRLRGWLIPEYVAGLAYASDSRHLAVALGTGVVYVLRVGEAGEGGR
jgi:hypothetical protein